jgi:hypothetical protein
MAAFPNPSRNFARAILPTLLRRLKAGGYKVVHLEGTGVPGPKAS